MGTAGDLLIGVVSLAGMGRLSELNMDCHNKDPGWLIQTSFICQFFDLHQ